MVLAQARMHRACGIISPIENLKLPTQTVEYDLHIEISLETKFYIFLNFFTIFNGGDKLVNLFFF